MAEKFEIGEVAIYVRPGSPYYGREVTVTGALTQGWSYDGLRGVHVHGPYYEIDGLPDEGDGRDWVAPPVYLRKKRPPPREIDRVVPWEDCLWKPQGVTRALA